MMLPGFEPAAELPGLELRGLSGLQPPRSITDASDQLGAVLALLYEYLVAHMHELPVDDVVRLFAVYTQGLARYARMQRDKHLVDGAPDDEQEAALAEALRLAGEELGVELLPGDETEERPDRERDSSPSSPPG